MGSQRKTRSGLGATRNGQGQHWAGKGMGETELGVGFQETLNDGASVDNLTAVERKSFPEVDKERLRKARCDVHTMKCSPSVKRNNRDTWSVWRKR